MHTNQVLSLLRAYHLLKDNIITVVEEAQHLIRRNIMSNYKNTLND